jgi:hypothetical protein
MSGTSGFAARQQRHGYADGAQALYEAVYQHIPPQDQMVLKHWLSELRRWEEMGSVDEPPPNQTLSDVSKTSAA